MSQSLTVPVLADALRDLVGGPYRLAQVPEALGAGDASRPRDRTVGIQPPLERFQILDLLVAAEEEAAQVQVGEVGEQEVLFDVIAFVLQLVVDPRAQHVTPPAEKGARLVVLPGQPVEVARSDEIVAGGRVAHGVVPGGDAELLGGLLALPEPAQASARRLVLRPIIPAHHPLPDLLKLLAKLPHVDSYPHATSTSGRDKYACWSKSILRQPGSLFTGVRGR
jgi:hypothetical protein